MWNHSIVRPVIFLILLSSIAQSNASAMPTIIGTAYDQGTGDILYTEHHFCREEGRVCTVEYRDVSDAMIALKTLDYRDSQFRPAVTFTDYRLDLELSMLANTREDLVVDAGFDNYVRSVWGQLESGESVYFPFLVAGANKPIDMRADREESGECGADQLCLEINLDSWWLGKLVRPIELSYSRENRRLLRFSGVSNIKGENGKSLNVDIHYQYNNQALLTGPI